MVGEEGIHQFLFLIDGLDDLSELGAELGPLVFQVVVSLLEFVVILEGFFLAVGHFRRGAFLLVLLEIPSLALFCGRTGFRFDVIRRSADVGAPVGENILHRQNLRAEIAQPFVDLLNAGSGVLAGSVVILFEFLVVRAGLDFFLRVAGLRAGAL